MSAMWLRSALLQRSCSSSCSRLFICPSTWLPKEASWLLRSSPTRPHARFTFLSSSANASAFSRRRACTDAWERAREGRMRIRRASTHSGVKLATVTFCWRAKCGTSPSFPSVSWILLRRSACICKSSSCNIYKHVTNKTSHLLQRATGRRHYLIQAKKGRFIQAQAFGL